MGTRSLTRVYGVWEDDKGKCYKKCLVAMYRQMDGYVSGHGAELKAFLKDMKICNGIGSEQSKGSWANGAGCLAAQIVSHFKGRELGRFYLEDEKNIQEYVYDIFVWTYELKADITIKIWQPTWDDRKYKYSEKDTNVIYEGSIAKMPTKDERD